MGRALGGMCVRSPGAGWFSGLGYLVLVGDRGLRYLGGGAEELRWD